MLSIKTSCPGATALTASATALVWARAVAGSARGSRTMNTSTSRIGRLRRIVPGAVVTFLKCRDDRFGEHSGPTITEFRT